MKILQKIQELASFIITLIVAVILAMMMFVVIKGADDWRDPQLWIQAGFNTLLQVIMIITWIPEGKKRGAQDTTYISNKTIANAKMQSAASADKFDSLTAFCAEMTKKNRKAWISNRVAKFGVIYERWEKESYRLQFDDKIQAKVKKAELQAPAKVKDIKATEIVTNSETNLIYDTKDHTDSVTKWKVLFKVIMSITLCTIGAFIQPEGVAFSVTAVVNFFYWLLLMCFSIFYAIRTGSQLITGERNDYYKRMIVFLTQFEAWSGANSNGRGTETSTVCEDAANGEKIDCQHTAGT